MDTAMMELCVFKLSGTYTLFPRIMLYLSWMLVVCDACRDLEYGKYTQNFLTGMMTFGILPAIQSFQLLHNWSKGYQAVDLDIFGVWIWLTFDLAIVTPFSALLPIIKPKKLAVSVLGLVVFVAVKILAFSLDLFLLSRPPPQKSQSPCSTITGLGHPSGDGATTTMDVSRYWGFHLTVGVLVIAESVVVLLWCIGVRKVQFDQGRMAMETETRGHKPWAYKIWLGFNVILLLTTIGVMEAFFAAAPAPLSFFDNYTQWSAPVLFVSTYIVWPALQISAEQARARKQAEGMDANGQGIELTASPRHHSQEPVIVPEDFTDHEYVSYRSGPDPFSIPASRSLGTTPNDDNLDIPAAGSLGTIPRALV